MNQEFNQLKTEKILQWQKLYAKVLVEELKPAGRVLEIGFKPRVTAEYIQQYPVSMHVIIESDPEKFKEAAEFAESRLTIFLSDEHWSKALSKLGIFDLIIFHEQTAEDDSTLERYLFAVETESASNEIKDVLRQIEEQMSRTGISYSDEVIEEFIQRTGQYHLPMLPPFFQKLLQNKNITQSQYDMIFEKHHLIHQPPVKNPLVSFEKKDDPKISCLEECLKSHLERGGRFSFFVYNGTSLYENSLFFDKVITNPDLDYRERRVPISLDGLDYDMIVPEITYSK